MSNGPVLLAVSDLDEFLIRELKMVVTTAPASPVLPMSVGCVYGEFNLRGYPHGRGHCYLYQFPFRYTTVISGPTWLQIHGICARTETGIRLCKLRGREYTKLYTKTK